MAVVGRADNGPTARLAALRALEALADERALDVALRAALDADAGVAAGGRGPRAGIPQGPAGPRRARPADHNCTRPRTPGIGAAGRGRGGQRPQSGDAQTPLGDAGGRSERRDPGARRRAWPGRPAGGQRRRPRINCMKRPRRGCPIDPETLRRLLTAAGASGAVADPPSHHRTASRAGSRGAGGGPRRVDTGAGNRAHRPGQALEPGRPLRPARSARSRVNAPAGGVSGSAVDCGRCVVPGSDCRRARARHGHVVAPAPGRHLPGHRRTRGPDAAPRGDEEDREALGRPRSAGLSGPRSGQR